LTRAFSALLALALLVASLLAIAEIVVAATGHGPWLVPYPEWIARMRERNWDDPVVRAILVGLVVLGLLLLLLAVRRGRPAALPLRARTPRVDVKVSRKSVERSLAAAASRTKGVTDADASLRRRRARIDARAATRSESGLQQQVESAVTARLESLGLTRPLRLRVHVSPKDRR
jgi:hypothetical protein